MAYQIKKTSRITEDIVLLGESGNAEKILHVEINPCSIIDGYRKAQINLVNAQRECKNYPDNIEVVEKYKNAIANFFEHVLGTENTDILLKYYNGEYIDMMFDMTPFIMNVVSPAMSEAIRLQKSRLADNMNFSRRQKRRLGLK